MSNRISITTKFTDIPCRWHADGEIQEGRLNTQVNLEAEQTDDEGRVLGREYLADISQHVYDIFYGKLMISANDPKKDSLTKDNDVVVSGVSSESLARLVLAQLDELLSNDPTLQYENILGTKYPRVRCRRVELSGIENNITAVVEG